MKSIFITLTLIAFLSSCTTRKVNVITENTRTEIVKEESIKKDSTSILNASTNTNINIVESANEIIITPIDPTIESKYNGQTISNATLVIRNTLSNKNINVKDTVSHEVTDKTKINTIENTKIKQNDKNKEISKTGIDWIFPLIIILILFLGFRYIFKYFI